MTALERTYRFLIARAEKENKTQLAKELRDWAYLNYDLDL